MLKRGVSGGIPLKRIGTMRAEVFSAIKALPACWIRADIVFWEIFADMNGTPNTGDLDEILKLCASSGKKLLLNLAPVPHPDFPSWQQVTGGRWPEWFRPDFRLWNISRQKAQWLIDHLSETWIRLGGQKSGLRFEWFNEPATGHVGGASPKSGQAAGVWDIAFHSFCNYMLVDEGHLKFQGHIVQGSTLSFFGEKEPEKQELQTAPGGDDGQWWSAMDRRCFNLAYYNPGPARNPEAYAENYRRELERVIGLMRALPVSAPKGPLCLHEWYLTKPMIGYRDGSCSDAFRAECIVAVGETIASFSEIEMAIFFALRHKPNESIGEYDKHGAFSGVERKALERFLRGKA